MRSGIVALSASRHCIRQKVRSRRPKPIRRPITLLECQGYLLPPSCNARNRQFIAPRSTIIPRGSKCFNFSLADRFLSGSLSILTLRPRQTIPNTRAPMGKLLQRTVSDRVNASQKADLHPEAPSPAHTYGQCATQDWTETCTDTETANDKTNIKRAPFQGSYECDDAYGPLDDERSTAAGHCPSEYEYWRIRSSCA